MTNPLKAQPSFISKRELWWTLTGITIILIFIAVITTIDLSNSGNPPSVPSREVYVFPQNTYDCLNTYDSDGTLQRLCSIREATPSGLVTVPPSATITESNTPESTIRTEVTQ